MGELFDYYGEKAKNSIKITIGQWLGLEFLKILRERGASVDVVNSIDRMKLAEKYLNDRIGKYTFEIFKGWYKGIRDYERYELENDIAQQIDLKIPLNYYMYIEEKNTGIWDNTILRQRYMGIGTVEGIKFLYDENYENERLLMEGKKNHKRRI